MWLGAAAIVVLAASGGVVAVRLVELVRGLAIGGLVPVVLPEDQPRRDFRRSRVARGRDGLNVRWRTDAGARAL